MEPVTTAALVTAGAGLIGKLFDGLFGGGGPEPQKPQMQTFRQPQMQAPQAPQAPVPQPSQPVPGIGASAAGGGANSALQRAIQMFMGGGR